MKGQNRENKNGIQGDTLNSTVKTATKNCRLLDIRQRPVKRSAKNIVIQSSILPLSPVVVDGYVFFFAYNIFYYDSTKTTLATT